MTENGSVKKLGSLHFTDAGISVFRFDSHIVLSPGHNSI